MQLADHEPGRYRTDVRVVVCAAAALLVFSACSEVEITDSGPNVFVRRTEDRPALCRVYGAFGTLLEDTTAAVGWNVAVFVEPGTEDSVPRQVQDTLWLDGQPVTPSTFGADGARGYRAAVTVDPETAHQRTITIQPPDVDDLTAETISFRGIGHVLGDTLRWDPTSDLIVSLDLPAVLAEPSPSNVEWAVTVSSGGRGSLSIRRPGIPPAEITIPAILLPDSAPPMYVSFGYQMNYGPGETEGSTYGVSYSISQGLSWYVEICQPGGCP